MLRSLTLRRQLFLALAVPCAALLVLAGLGVRAKWLVVRDASALTRLATFGVTTSELVHATQKERAVTVGFAASGGTRFAAEMSAQRRAVDERLARFRAVAAGLHAERFGPELDGALRGALAAMDSLVAARDAAQRLALSPAQLTARYSATIERLLATTRPLDRLAVDVATAARINAYQNLIEAKERVGRERAILNDALSVGRFAGDGYARFVSVVAEQRPLVEMFAENATPAQRALYDARMRDPAVVEAARIRDLALAAGDGRPLAVEPARWYEAITRTIDLLKEVEDASAADLERHVATVSSDARRALVASLVLSVLGTLLALAIGAVIVRHIVRRVRETAARVDELRTRAIAGLGAASDAMARGELTIVVDADVRPLDVAVDDEIGALGRSINEIIAQTRQTATRVTESVGIIGEVIGATNALIAAAERGELTTRADPSRFQGGFRQFVSGANRMLDSVAAPMVEAIEVLTRVSDRDLTARMRGAYAGEHARMQEALNRAASDLQAALAEVAAASQQVAAAGSQISAASQSLAEGANEQASSLEEVAASIQEVSATVQSTAVHAADVQSLMQVVGGEMAVVTDSMERLTGAVRDIEAGAQRTAKIVKTIDEIAFQTNLLALNAAVEAARAGDAGKGFAVVADEVRALALRSAEAAKQTAELIHAAVEAASAGVRLNGEALAGITRIGEHTQQHIAHADEIAEATREQAEGLRQIGVGTEQMNAATQRAAASAEESAATAEELAGQAARLRELVDAFEIGTGGEGSVHSAREGAVFVRPMQNARAA